MKFAALLALLFAHSAFASGLDDLKVALATLQGQGSLRGTYEARQYKNDLEKKSRGPESASASAQVEDDADGFQIRWDRAVLKRAMAEAKPGKSANSVEPLTSLIGSASATKLAQVVNYAPVLLQTLSVGQLKSERADTWNGKPARLLELTIAEQDPEDDKVSMKENVRTAQVWIGQDGIPLAASFSRKVRAKVMMFMSFEMSNKDDYTFGVVANRLVVLKREEQGTAKGMGSDTQFRNSYTFTPKA